MQGGTREPVHPKGEASSAGTQTPRQIAIALICCIGLYAAVVIARPIQFFFDDSYFYFQVAWNIAHGHGSTFNGLIPTNGYHPLWMAICVAIYWLVSSKLAALHAIATVTCLCDCCELFLLWRLVETVADGVWGPAFLLAVPFDFLSQLGTEGALSGLLLAATALLAYRFASAPRTSSAFAFHCAAALAVTTHLDNIFIVGCTWLALCIAVRGSHGHRARLLSIYSLPMYAILWGAYLAANVHFFGAIQPISGILKAHPVTHVRWGSNIPHTGWLALGVIAICIAFEAWRNRDIFFLAVEVPFAAGVAIHALYILFIMTDETRWSWYYTSWVLLASILLARLAAAFFRQMLPARAASHARNLAAYGCIVMLAAAWAEISLRHHYLAPAADPMAVAETTKALGIERAFAFDRPGVVAYYTQIRVIPLDGLMGNLAFEKELTAGVNRYAIAKRIDGFIGPPVPFTQDEHRSYCDRLILDAVRFSCAESAPGEWWPTRAEVYSRVPASDAGALKLDRSQLVWTRPELVSIWKLAPDERMDREPGRP